MHRSLLLIPPTAAILLSLALVGCRSATAPDAPPAATADESTDAGATGDDASTQTPAATEGDGNVVVAPAVVEIDTDALLAARLSPEELAEGWVRLFDGQSLVGWFAAGDADWHVSDGAIRVTGGEKSFLCTSFELPNYELKVDFRSDAATNSGIFLRTGPRPGDIASECLELNIAPPDHGFPTGSFVQRQRLEPADLADFDPTQWHTYHVRMLDRRVEVSIDDRQVMELDDLEVAPTGHISLQFNTGRVEFRNVLLHPLQLEPLKLGDDWREDWAHAERDEGTFRAEPTDQGMHLTGGLGQLQTERSFGDFVLQASYTLAAPEVNSGIFFRCVPGAMLDGYECQVNHAVVDGDPLRPADAGAGAIFRRQAARIVVGNGATPTHLTLLANGPHIVTWVNGLQVAEFTDTRPEHENPRNGLRLEPGPISLQGHDPATDVTFHGIAIAELERAE